MILVPWRFYEDLSCFNREMHQLFDRFFGTEFIEDSRGKIPYPPMQIAETENEIIAFLKIFPLSPHEIEITYNDDHLVIKGEKERADASNLPQKETTSFKRIIHIPKKIYPEKIEAKFKGGDLIIILPKIKNTGQSIKITIE